MVDLVESRMNKVISMMCGCDCSLLLRTTFGFAEITGRLWLCCEIDTYFDRVCDGYDWQHFVWTFGQNPQEIVYTSFLAFARHTVSRCLKFRANVGIGNLFPATFSTANQLFTHVYFLPVPTYEVKWVVLFGFSFLGPLLQRSLWTDHPLWGQIWESCSHNKTLNLVRTILAEKLVWPTTGCTARCHRNSLIYCWS